MGQDDRIRRCKSTTTLEIFILFLPALEYILLNNEFYKITILVKFFFFVPYLLYPESKVITYIKFGKVMFMQHTNVWNYQRVSGLSEGKNKIIKLGFAKSNVLVMEKKVRKFVPKIWSIRTSLFEVVIFETPFLSMPEQIARTSICTVDLRLFRRRKSK